MKRIAWVSRHPPLDAQIAALEAAFGPVEVIYDGPQGRVSGPFRDAAEIIARVREYDECVVVAPQSVITRLCELGLHPLYAKMIVVEPGESYEVEAAGRCYRFDRFVRIVEVRVVEEEITAATPPRSIECAFCALPRDQVKKMIEGPNGVCVCGECVDTFHEIVTDDDA